MSNTQEYIRYTNKICFRTTDGFTRTDGANAPPSAGSKAQATIAGENFIFGPCVGRESELLATVG
jgi:hypothetical protein